MPYALTNAVLTMQDHLMPGRLAAEAARAALTRRPGQPGALDPHTAGQWADAVATLHTHLSAGNLPDPDDPLTLPFRGRYQRCRPITDLTEHEHDDSDPGPAHRHVSRHV